MQHLELDAAASSAQSDPVNNYGVGEQQAAFAVAPDYLAEVSNDERRVISGKRCASRRRSWTRYDDLNVRHGAPVDLNDDVLGYTLS